MTEKPSSALLKNKALISKLLEICGGIYIFFSFVAISHVRVLFSYDPNDKNEIFTLGRILSKIYLNLY